MSVSDSDGGWTAWDRRAFWLAFLIALGVYVHTLAPTVTLEDSGELATAGDYLGVPHPPGYPSWTIGAWAFARVFSFVPFRGNPNPAWAINLFSAVSGALAAGLIASLLSRSTQHLDTGPDDDPAPAPRSWAGTVAGVTGALAFAFSPAMWSQSVIVEVYALNALFLALVLSLAYRWALKPQPRTLWMMCLAFGIGLTNYQVLLLLGAALAVLILLRRPALFRDFVIAGLPMLLVAAIAKMGGFPDTPLGRRYALHELPFDTPYYLLMLAMPLLAWISILLTRRPGIAGRVAAGVAGITLLAGPILAFTVDALPILEGVPQPADLYPPITAAHGAALGICLLILFALCAIARGALRAGLVGASLVLTLATLLLRSVPITYVHPTHIFFWSFIGMNGIWLMLIRYALPHGRTVALSLLAAELGVGMYAIMPLLSEFNPPMNWAYPLTWEGFWHAVGRKQYEPINPSEVLSVRYLEQLGVYLTDLRRQFTLALAPLALLPFAAWQICINGRRVRTLLPAAALTASGIACVLIERFLLPDLALVGTLWRGMFSVLLALSGLGIAIALMRVVTDHTRDVFRPELDGRARITAAMPALGVLLVYLLFVAAMLTVIRNPGSQPESVAAAIAAIPAPALLLAMIGWMAWRDRSLRLLADRQTHHWFLTTLTAFLVLSALLISLANLKGDLQDTFIQRVKFIPSHALFALWIGYGLYLGLRAVDAATRSPRLRHAALLLACALPTVGLLQNIGSPGLIREMGGSEQNGHDFGWQFGYYSLRGAAGINEELSAQEEPLPNPEYPPPMTRDAIFYGGTDPGRFVPTYMIYSADVRPDVYLITQNALADNTFMSVTRDLYGDQIWLPTPRDSGRAFSAYVQEMREKDNAYRVAGGRISISGAQQVMVINGKLARMIFERNRFRHDFYVEESYVIDWMYPFMRPSGIVLALDSEERGPLTAAEINSDMDFWGWYTRRLTDSPAFLRDINARKAFSKLRTATAGLYVYRKNMAAAEHAYTEAIMCYPASPEANMKLVSFVLWRAGRFAEALRVLERFGELDPNNRTAPGVYAQVRDALAQTQQRHGLRDKLLDRSITPKEVSALLRQLGGVTNRDGYRSLARHLLADTNWPNTVALEIARTSREVGEKELMDAAYRVYVVRAGGHIATDELRGILAHYAEIPNLKALQDFYPLYIRLAPQDMKARLNLAVVQIIQKNYDGAFATLHAAIAVGGDGARTLMREDPRLAPALEHPKFKPLITP